jgi:hypothetical protein
VIAWRISSSSNDGDVVAIKDKVCKVDSTKSTLFGRFYEQILSEWLKTKGFKARKGKPRVYWEDIESTKGDSTSANGLNNVLNKYKMQKEFCTPDGLLDKGGSCYIWEAKNWPGYTGNQEPLDQLRGTLLTMPQILATKAKYRNKYVDIHGFVFSWWSEPDGVNDLLGEIIELIAPNTFEIFYTDKIIGYCKREGFDWYSGIIDREKRRTDELFKDLLDKHTEARTIFCLSPDLQKIK